MGLKIIEMGEARDALELACGDPSRVVLLCPRHHRPRHCPAKPRDELSWTSTNGDSAPTAHGLCTAMQARVWSYHIVFQLKSLSASAAFPIEVLPWCFPGQIWPV
jgi:hypothetical protein